ncbi:MAG: ShlB/FhaC/HecB family hemolysin secretion/activation protein [Syntrophales bacterium]
MKRLSCLFLCPVLVVTLLCGVVAAASPPDPGTLLKEWKQSVSPAPDRLPPPAAEREKKTDEGPVRDAGIRVPVREFRFTGVAGIVGEAELQALVRDSIGKRMGMADLQRTAALVTNYLREKKDLFLARAYLPRQDITEGVVEIAILAGRFDGQVRIDMQGPHRIRPSLLKGIVERALPADGSARMEDVERAALLMNDLPGISARVSLEPAETPGTTRIVVHASEGPIFQGSLIGNSFGSRYTGALQGFGMIAASDPLGIGDRIRLLAMGAERSIGAAAYYSIPFGSTGWNGTLSYISLAGRPGEEFAPLDMKFRGDVIGAKLEYPLLRSRRADVRTGLELEHQILGSEAAGVNISDRRVSSAGLFLSGNLADAFRGGGRTDALLSVSGTHADLSGNADDESGDGAGPGVSGGAFKLNYSLSRLQNLSRLVSLFGWVRGQFASDNLDAAHQFHLGGDSGVRAYSGLEACGSEGHILTFETRLALPFMPPWAAAQLIGFIDTGWIRLYKDLWPGAITNATGKNEYRLSGAGLGFQVGKSGLYSLRAYYAHRIGENDGRSTTGLDAENLDSNGRFGLEFMLFF